MKKRKSQKQIRKKKVSICGNVFSLANVDTVSPVEVISQFDIDYLGHQKGFSFCIGFYSEKGKTTFTFATEEEAMTTKENLEKLIGNIVKL